MPLLGIFFLLFEFSDVKDRIDDIARQPDPCDVTEDQTPTNTAPVIGGIENKKRAGCYSAYRKKEKVEPITPVGDQRLMLYLKETEHGTYQKGHGKRQQTFFVHDNA